MGLLSRLSVALFVTVVFCTIASAQHSDAKAVFAKTSGKPVMIAVYDLVEQGDCSSSRRYQGNIVGVHYDAEYAVRINGLTLELADGAREYFEIDPILYALPARLPDSDIDWLYTLIAKDKRVVVDVYLCGVSGRVALVRNIIAQNQTRPRRPSK